MHDVRGVPILLGQGTHTPCVLSLRVFQWRVSKFLDNSRNFVRILIASYERHVSYDNDHSFVRGQKYTLNTSTQLIYDG
jgi:hypothetical protein